MNLKTEVTMLRNTILATLIILLAGCSVFRHTSKDESINVQQERNNNVITDTVEDIMIEIPQEVFAGLAASQLSANNSDSANNLDDGRTGIKTGKKVDKRVIKPKGDNPVRITIKRKTQVQDKSVTKTDSTYNLDEENTVKKEPKMGFGFGFIFAILGVAVVIIIILYKAIK